MSKESFDRLNHCKQLLHPVVVNDALDRTSQHNYGACVVDDHDRKLPVPHQMMS